MTSVEFPVPCHDLEERLKHKMLAAPESACGRLQDLLNMLEFAEYYGARRVEPSADDIAFIESVGSL